MNCRGIDSKQDVLDWFGDRGIPVNLDNLKAWHWENGKLWYIIANSDNPLIETCIESTDQGYADLSYTHRDDGSPILCYELYDSIPIKDSPLRGKNGSETVTSHWAQKRSRSDCSLSRDRGILVDMGQQKKKYLIDCFEDDNDFIEQILEVSERNGIMAGHAPSTPEAIEKRRQLMKAQLKKYRENKP